MSHQQQDCGEEKLLLSKYAMNGTMCWSTKCTFGNYNFTCQENLRRQQYYTTVVLQKGSFFTKHEEGKVFFRRRLKNGMYANFMHRKEIYYINIHTYIQYLTHIQILHFLSTQEFSLLLVSSRQLRSRVCRQLHQLLLR
jgi:hypothetical protein